MTINYIITCGTSQLDYDRIGAAFPSGSNAFDRWVEKNKNEDQSESPEMETIACELKDDFDQRRPGIPNSLGAELSTLKLLRQEQKLDNSEKEKFTVLASDSNKGQLAAEILTKTLVKAGFEGCRVTVRDLDENPENSKVNPAMCSLVDNLYMSLQSGDINKLIITGGFKSILPCTTLFATLNGLEMYYLFEESNFLQSLQPTGESLKNPKIRHKWIKEWRKLLSNETKNTNSWLYLLFDSGLKHNEQFG